MKGLEDAVDVDPFDLPDWLGVSQVTWEPDGGVRAGAHVRGQLSSAEGSLPCDLLAVDEAYPQPVADDHSRARAHLAWRHGQVLLLAYAGRVTLVVPGTRFTADLILDALVRLALAVGASPDGYAARLRLGAAAPALGAQQSSGPA